MNWRLRKPDGTIYGPVAFAEFYRWATEGRILPEDKVSEGDGEWIPAPDAPALELDWLLPHGKGQQLGPLHLLAFAELLQQRLLQGHEPVVKKSGGDPTPVGQAVAAELLRRAEAIQSELAAARAELRAARRAPPQHENSDSAASFIELEAARRHAEESSARATALESELNELRKTHAAAAADLELLRARAAELQRALDSSDAELALARENLTRAEARVRELEQAANTLTTAPHFAKRPEKLNAEGLEKEFQDLTRRYERLLARAREEAERNAELQKALDAERTSAATRQAENEERLRAAQEQVAALSTRIEEQSRLYEELVRNFRDLNDRYIRLRDDKEAATDTPSTKPKVRLV